jgi:DNA segregation ATPase FtsK/SpoIIIE, S-DNA-T family
MSEPRNIRWDIAALVFSAVAVFVWLSLVSYDAGDPVTPAPAILNAIYSPYPAEQLAYPINATIQNRCGYFGAYVSQAMMHAFGAGAYLVAALFILTIVVMIRQKPLASPLGRSLGWTTVLVTILTLLELSTMVLPMRLPLGPGGAIGAMGAAWMNSHFALLGSIVICLCCLVVGLMLSTEYAVFRGVSFLTIGMIVIGRRLGLPVAQVVKQTAAIGTRGLVRLQGSPSITVKSDAASPTTATTTSNPIVEREPFEGDMTGPPIRIGGRHNEAKSEQIVALEKTTSSDNPVANPDESSKKLSSTRTRSITTSAVSKIASTLGSMAGLKAKADEVAQEESDASDEETDDSEYVDLNVDGEEIAARIDTPHDNDEPKIKTRKSRTADKPATNFLETLDDTKLPEGSEEYVLPGLDLLTPSEDVSYEEQMVEIRRKAKVLEQTFADFGFKIRVVEIETGPVIAQYEIELEAGLRLSKITSLADDLAIALRVPSVRIVAPIPGKNTVGIEVPNEKRQVVLMREVIEETGNDVRKMKIPLFLGKDVSGKPLSVDLASMPHLLIAGRTGTGKSVCLNTIITSMLMTRRPDEVRMLMIDPKMVELSGYGRLPHLMHPVVTDMQKAEAILAWAVDKMEERYALLARAGVRHLVSYNQLDRAELLDRIKPESTEEEQAIPEHLPFIVIVADEIADMMMTAGKEVEQHIIRLAQKSRAVGIHLILATQKPTVDVITGLIKSNLPARISFQVASRTDSRVVLDEMGADKLLGNGDMLFLWPGTSTLLRGQGTYLSDEEINRIVKHCSQGEQKFVHELLNINVDKDEDSEGKDGKSAANFRKRDELYEAAVDVVVREGRGSCSLLQRALGIGYGRAARLIDFMAEDGIVGQYNGSQARDVIVSLPQWEAMRTGSEVPPPLAEAGRKNRVRRDEGWDEPASQKVAAGADDENDSPPWDEH